VHKFRQQESAIEGQNPRVPRTTPLRELFVPRIVTVVLNYGLLAFIEIALYALLPVVYNTPISRGGLGLPPSVIGYALSAFGIANGLFQMAALHYLIEKLGCRTLYLVGFAFYTPAYLLFPCMNAVARNAGVSWAVWVLIALQLVAMIIADLTYGEHITCAVVLPS
jgi:hypothetical protein